MQAADPVRPVASLEVSAMTMIDPNEVVLSRPDPSFERRESGHRDTSPPRPYSDTGNLYEIPPVRPDDPPLREWWIDDETSDRQPRR